MDVFAPLAYAASPFGGDAQAMRDNLLVVVDVHDVIGCQVLHVHEGQCRHEWLTVTQMLVVLDRFCKN